MLFDVLMNVFLCNSTRMPLFVSNRNEQNILIMHLNIILFLCLNNEKLVSNFINDKPRFDKFISIMKTRMMESSLNNEFITELSKMNKPKYTFTPNFKLYNDLKENQVYIGRILEKLYELSYETVLANK